MTNYIVGGATGRVGSAVAAELLSRGENTTVILRDPARRAEWIDRGAGVALGSLADRSFLSDTLRGATGFFALLPENVPPDDFHGHRRRMADAIAGAADDSGIPHVVMLSAVAAVLADGNGPAKELHYLENRLRAGGPTVSILRSAYFQDNIGGVLMPAINNSIYPYFLPSADAAFPMIATKDAGRFAAEALLNPPALTETVLLLGPAYSVRDAAGRLGAALGKQLEPVPIPAEAHVATLTQAGVPQQLAEAVAEMFAAFGKGLIVPAGDRQLVGTTEIDEVIADCLARQRGSTRDS
jgi:uncharacterized protein YbjT (DUF2867 family)